MASMAALQPAGINCLVVEPTPPKNDGVRWDDEIPYIVNFTIPTDELIFQRGRRTNHQPDNDFNG
jgi:hypothetical protein